MIQMWFMYVITGIGAVDLGLWRNQVRQDNGERFQIPSCSFADQIMIYDLFSLYRK